ncbi:MULTISPECIES: hypothetical protein [unclassified Roseibium]|uniref:hypothetical protein n=1 Tax=unclassified Roseibium TaxID=2629323 RepID=UPI00092888D3|nr:MULTISPECIES: hypothetical protein [unclassified Roseibium]OJJ12004.1 hypothetical protein BKI51_10110 [Alphaproteobacteria bacterium AO1-B]
MLGKRVISIAAIISALVSGAGVAGDVEIVDATAKEGAGGWTFSVTLKHGDTGWDHYSDLWEVYTPEGELLGKRVLAHPHVNEQPFTRSLSGVQVPDDITSVIIRARDSVHGVSPQEFRLELP